jgi:hypothetical protein
VGCLRVIDMTRVDAASLYYNSPYANEYHWLAEIDLVPNRSGPSSDAMHAAHRPRI